MSGMTLAAWAGLELVAPLAGGARNQVMLARRGDERLVVRRSGRSPAALDWDLDLLEHLAGQGISVPALVPADDWSTGTSRVTRRATTPTGDGWWTCWWLSTR
jgi:Ser/Thr protein kinase RdoA (MazF antagonist)